MKRFYPKQACGPARSIAKILGALFLLVSFAANANQPTPYSRQSNFSDWSQNYPDLPHNGTSMDNEFNAVKATLDQTLANLLLIQRDDGALQNSVVHIDSLQPQVLALLNSDLNPRGAWVTGTAYALLDLVTNTGSTYVCLSAHTSGTFSTDLAS